MITKKEKLEKAIEVAINRLDKLVQKKAHFELSLQLQKDNLLKAYSYMYLRDGIVKFNDQIEKINKDLVLFKNELESILSEDRRINYINESLYEHVEIIEHKIKENVSSIGGGSPDFELTRYEYKLQGK